MKDVIKDCRTQWILPPLERGCIRRFYWSFFNFQTLSLWLALKKKPYSNLRLVSVAEILVPSYLLTRTQINEFDFGRKNSAFD